MRTFFAICASLMLLSACGTPTGPGGTNPSANPSGTPSSSPSNNPDGNVSAGGDIYASKAAYFAFLDCAAKKDATAAQMAGIFKTQLNIYGDAQWAQAKIIVQATHKSFVDTYGAGCK